MNRRNGPRRATTARDATEAAEGLSVPIEPVEDEYDPSEAAELEPEPEDQEDDD